MKFMPPPWGTCVTQLLCVALVGIGGHLFRDMTLIVLLAIATESEYSCLLYNYLKMSDDCDIIIINPLNT